MNRKVIQRLIWKDGRMLAPLALATLVSIIGLNLLLVLLTSWGIIGREQLMIAEMIWILGPNLLALGASAMLVGGEEESGSLSWLRTLPANWRGVALSKLTVVLPYALVYCGRWATLPKDPVAWRQQTLSFELRERPGDQAPIQIDPNAIPEQSLLYDPFRREGYLIATEQDDFEQRFEKEMAAEDSVGQFVTFNELVARVPSWPNGAPEIDFYDETLTSTLADRNAQELRVCRLLLKWSTMIRNAALFGDASFKQVAHVAERADEIVATVLEEQIVQQGMTPEIKELIHLFPDNHLVLQSRRNSLIVAWKKYRQSSDPWIQFSGIFHRPRPFLWPNLELVRRQRFTDQTAKMAEQHWRSGALSGLSELSEFYRDSREAGLWDVMGPLRQGGVREQIESLKDRIQ